jgi:signal transduction histidine kinase
VESFFAAVHPEDVALVQASERRAEQTGLHDVVHRIVRPDGEVRHVHELARYERDGQQQVVRLIGTVQDVTDLKRIEQALIAARDEAERANRAKSDFLSSMSHELRTPMNAILGFSQLMEFDDNLPAEHKENVREIISAGSHLLQLINEVLDLAKVESGRIALTLEPVDVHALVEESLKLVSTAAEQRAIRVQYTGLEDAVVRADRTRLKQALLNLLSNAVKYNRANGRVEVVVQRTDQGQLRILVRDTGPGIAPDKLGKLFQPFSRLGAEATGVEGTGIGLTITRRIIEMMGGRVDVSSEAGVGSTFWIDLPLEYAHRVV